MSSEPFAIRVQDLSKHYLMFDRPEDRLKQSIVPRLQRLVGQPPKRYFRDFAALNGVSFEIGRGETVGILGRNGSGKSTLLQIVCGTLQPSSGSVEVNGRIAALLELGAGFNPEFTGRENVFLNAAILGLSRAEVEQRFDAITAFADIGLFIDQPVKTYSSGMYVRLAFAVAINVDPDIMVVDEALAVGDEAFQRKCFARIEQIQECGATILFVSHGAQTIIQLCSRAMLFDGGELLLQGRPKTVVSHYQRLVNLSGEEALAVRDAIRAVDASEEQDNAPSAEGEPAAGDASAGDAEVVPEEPQSLEAFDPELVSLSSVEYECLGARICDVRLSSMSGKRVNIVEMGRRYAYEYKVDFDEEAHDVGFAMLVNTVTGSGLGGVGTGLSRSTRVAVVSAGAVAHVRLEFECRMLPGAYFLNAGVSGRNDHTEGGFLHRIIDALAIRVAPSDELIATGVIDLDVRPHIRLEAPERNSA